MSLDVEAEDGTVEGALQRYLEPEILDGENRWASPAGRCAARKGVRFARLPPAIVLHLKRFAYDACGTRSARSARRCACPSGCRRRRLRARRAGRGGGGRGGGRGGRRAGRRRSAPDDDRDPRLLHAVVVHVGGGRGGHYYAYVDPLLDGRWVKFDDDRVSAADARVVAAEAAGAELGGGNSVGAYLGGALRASAAPRLGLRGGAAETDLQVLSSSTTSRSSSSPLAPPWFFSCGGVGDAAFRGGRRTPTLRPEGEMHNTPRAARRLVMVEIAQRERAIWQSPYDLVGVAAGSTALDCITRHTITALESCSDRRPHAR